MDINEVKIKTYKTHEIAKFIGVHPNTVRLYEDIGFIEKPQRLDNGYRVFTQIHIDQMKIARLALKGELLQNGLRKKAVNIIKLTAKRNFDKAILETNNYIDMLKNETTNAIEAIRIVEEIIEGFNSYDKTINFTRKEAANFLNITVDTLRNWELNGLITVKRKENGYRIYDSQDIKQLKVIRSLRCANYSLSAILRLLNNISKQENVNVTQVLNTPDSNEDIISVCDKLLVSLKNTKIDAETILKLLSDMKSKY